MKELIERLETNPETGLTKEGAEAKIKEYGRNVLSEKKKEPWYFKLLKEFIGFFGILLMVGGFLCFLAYGLSPSDPSTVSIVYIFIKDVSGYCTFYGQLYDRWYHLLLEFKV